MFSRLTVSMALVLLCFCGVIAQTNDPENQSRYLTTHMVLMHFQNQATFDVGVGSVAGYNLRKNFSIETESNLFPERNHATDQSFFLSTAEDFRGGRKEQVFLRVKAGYQFGRFGLFFKAGPGFLTQSKGATRLNRERSGCTATALSSCFDSKYTINLAGDVGGSLEISTSKHTFVRLDAGSMLLEGGAYINNFKQSSGFGIRF